MVSLLLMRDSQESQRKSTGKTFEAMGEKAQEINLGGRLLFLKSLGHKKKMRKY